jgi:hypothetical protein
MARYPVSIRISAVASVAMLAAACGSINHLADFDLRDATLEGVYDVPPVPEVLTGFFVVGDPREPVDFLIRTASRVALEVEAEELKAKLDSAVVRTDAAARLADRTLQRSARHLGMRTVTDHADFLLEVNVDQWGIRADSWDAAAYFYVTARASLLERSTGTTAWSVEVGENQILTAQALGLLRGARDAVSAAALASLSVDELVRALEQLADYCSDELTRRLQEDLDEARGGP